MASSTANQLHLLQQNLQVIQQQKQQLEAQALEMDSALIELRKTKQAYTILGNLMIASSAPELIKELEEKKESNEIRLKNLVQQEEKIHRNFKELQQKMVKENSKT